MRFFEYAKKNGFDYFALIGAETREAANSFYEEAISGRDGAEPIEIAQDEARKKLLAICDSEESKNQAIKDFDNYTSKPRPYMVLCDSEFV